MFVVVVVVTYYYYQCDLFVVLTFHHITCQRVPIRSMFECGTILTAREGAGPLRPAHEYGDALPVELVYPAPAPAALSQSARLPHATLYTFFNTRYGDGRTPRKSLRDRLARGRL